MMENEYWNDAITLEHSRQSSYFKKYINIHPWVKEVSIKHHVSMYA
jgi:hypothetical protein